MVYRRGSGHTCLGHIVHASDAYYLPRDSTPHDWSPPNDESTQNTRGLPLRGSIDFRGVHSRASEVIVATSMIDSDYRYTQDAHQKDRSAILQWYLGRSQGQGAVRMLILDLAGTTTYRKLFHLLKVNCFRTSQITYGITVGRAPKFVVSIT